MHPDSKKPRLVFDFIRSPSKQLDNLNAGKSPKEMLLGYAQLQERGWPISASDDRWNGIFGNLRKRLIFKLEIPSLNMIQAWRGADIIVVTTRISLVLALISKALGKKLVFLDAMCEEVPKRFWRRWVIKLSIRLSDACINLSSSQAQHWANRLNIPKKSFTPVFYGVDVNYYKRPLDNISKNYSKPYLLAVGRDPRRDFSTLVCAANILNWDLNLVTQDYLISESIKDNPRVHVLDGLSYDDLFRLYSGAEVVVVPIKKDTTYMSGIRATMEAMLLEIPVVASCVSGMPDYFNDGKELIYFEPGDCESLLQAIHKIIDNDHLKAVLVRNAKQRILKVYSVSNYADSLERILQSL